MKTLFPTSLVSPADDTKVARLEQTELEDREVQWPGVLQHMQGECQRIQGYCATLCLPIVFAFQDVKEREELILEAEEVSGKEVSSFVLSVIKFRASVMLTERLCSDIFISYLSTYIF